MDEVKESSPIFVTECWARSWSMCTGSQPTGDLLNHSPVIGCHYFSPGLRSPSQPMNITGMMWSQRRVPAISRAVAFYTNCNFSPLTTQNHDNIIATVYIYLYSFSLYFSLILFTLQESAVNKETEWMSECTFRRRRWRRWHVGQVRTDKSWYVHEELIK